MKPSQDSRWRTTRTRVLLIAGIASAGLLTGVGPAHAQPFFPPPPPGPPPPAPLTIDPVAVQNGLIAAAIVLPILGGLADGLQSFNTPVDTAPATTDLDSGADSVEVQDPTNYPLNPTNYGWANPAVTMPAAPPVANDPNCIPSMPNPFPVSGACSAAQIFGTQAWG
jgi:hypothetical protein